MIAPNMAKGIVALQATLARMSTDFPGAFDGYKLGVTESHQSTKKDVSGTAVALCRSFEGLTGAPFDKGEIVSHRDDLSSTAFGVPPSALKGHAFHTYSLKGADDTVEFQFRHNVCGRRVYAEGTVDAVLFLAWQIAAFEGGKTDSKKRLFTMIDILSEGGM